MKKFFDKVFTNNVLLIIAPILVLIGGVFINVQYLKFYGTEFIAYFCNNAMMVLCSFLLVIAFKKHQKNVTKAMMGALYILIIPECLYNVVVLSYYLNNLPATIICGVELICLSLMFINHIFMISQHKANPKLILASRIAAFVAILANIGFEVYSFVAAFDFYIFFALGSLLYCIGSIYLIIAIESKVDYYKEIRDSKEA